jgi:hypothetical protein
MVVVFHRFNPGVGTGRVRQRLNLWDPGDVLGILVAVLLSIILFALLSNELLTHGTCRLHRCLAEGSRIPPDGGGRAGVGNPVVGRAVRSLGWSGCA